MQQNAEFPVNVALTFWDWFLKDLVTKQGINQRSKWIDNQEESIQWELGRMDSLEMKEEADLRKEFKESLTEMRGKYQASREDTKGDLKKLEELRVYLQSCIL